MLPCPLPERRLPVGEEQSPLLLALGDSSDPPGGSRRTPGGSGKEEGGRRVPLSLMQPQIVPHPASPLPERRRWHVSLKLKFHG